MIPSSVLSALGGQSGVASLVQKFGGEAKVDKMVFLKSDEKMENVTQI